MKCQIIARMRGGLGNQLFILACAYAIAGDKQYEIVLDTREYNTYKVRNFELFNLIKDSDLRFWEKNDSSLFYDVSRRIYHVAQKFLGVNKPISKLGAKVGLCFSKRSAMGLENIKSKKVYVYGYFQDASMVSCVKEKLLKHIKFEENENLYAFEKDTAYIGISVRCGQDYIDQGWPICSEEYFTAGVREIVNEKYANRRVKLLVFSDDLSKAKRYNFGENVEFVENMSSSEQIILMSKCDDFVISNSSFSWWGAFLGAKDDSIVILPNIWYDTKEPTADSLLQYQNTRIRTM